jgi:hypothetical protein
MLCSIIRTFKFLLVWDEPSPDKPHVHPYVFLAEALEICRTINDVEALLNETDRDSGMLLFAVDGKNNEFALFECMRSKYYRRGAANGWIIGTNHYCACQDRTLTDADKEPLGTLSRFQRMEYLIQKICPSAVPANLPSDLIRILADNEIERRGRDVVTVYSNIACPTTGRLWYTFGGYPAASQGNWQRLEWPW